MNPIRVVVVGAGASARSLVKFLKLRANSMPSFKVHVTVIQPNKFASLPYYQTLVLTKRDTFTNNSTFCEIEKVDKTIYGVAVACSDGVVGVEPLGSSTTIEVPFDVLVVATGSSFPTLTETPGQSVEERQHEIDEVSEALLSGKHIVIAGGGTTGVELAADVLEGLPECNRKGKVTLICSSDRLIANQPMYYSEKCRQVLENLGGTILFNERVESHSETSIASSNEGITLELKSGKTLDCHAYIPAYARGPNTKWLATAHKSMPGLPAELLNKRGEVVVNEYLQSEASTKVYAIGAVNSTKTISLSMNVQEEAKVVAANILKSKSVRANDGLESPAYQLVGHDTFATFIPENLPIPRFCAMLCCHWCGFPVNLLCPCFCCAVICGPVDPYICGMCCGKPEGPGLPKTLAGLKKMNVMAKEVGYVDVGSVSTAEAMERQ